MTRFERDVIEIEEGNEIEVLKRRKAELDNLYKKGRCEKNSFKRQCIAQEYTRLKAEYDALVEVDISQTVKKAQKSLGFFFI